MGLIQVGVIIGAHGIKGDVKIKCFLEDPKNLKTYSPFQSQDGDIFKVLSARILKLPTGVAQLQGITNRNQAEALVGTELWMEDSKLPNLEANTFYVHDLLGAQVFNEEGFPLGPIVSIQNYGAGDLLEIKLPQETVLVPFHHDWVIEADIEAKTLVILQEYLDQFL